MLLLQSQPAFGLASIGRAARKTGSGWAARSWATTGGTGGTTWAAVPVWRPCWRTTERCLPATALSGTCLSVRVSGASQLWRLVNLVTSTIVQCAGVVLLSSALHHRSSFSTDSRRGIGGLWSPDSPLERLCVYADDTTHLQRDEMLRHMRHAVLRLHRRRGCNERQHPQLKSRHRVLHRDFVLCCSDRQLDRKEHDSSK